eukprot:3461011-Pleurochrysis_carterae.AAC.1
MRRRALCGWNSRAGPDERLIGGKELGVDSSLRFGQKRVFNEFGESLGGRRARFMKREGNTVGKIRRNEEIGKGAFVLDVPTMSERVDEIVVKRAFTVVRVQCEQVLNVTTEREALFSTGVSGG